MAFKPAPVHPPCPPRPSSSSSSSILLILLVLLALLVLFILLALVVLLVHPPRSSSSSILLILLILLVHPPRPPHPPFPSSSSSSSILLVFLVLLVLLVLLILLVLPVDPPHPPCSSSSSILLICQAGAEDRSHRCPPAVWAPCTEGAPMVFSAVTTIFMALCPVRAGGGEGWVWFQESQESGPWCRTWPWTTRMGHVSSPCVLIPSPSAHLTCPQEGCSEVCADSFLQGTLPSPSFSLKEHWTPPCELQAPLGWALPQHGFTCPHTCASPRACWCRSPKCAPWDRMLPTVGRG